MKNLIALIIISSSAMAIDYRDPDPYCFTRLMNGGEYQSREQSIPTAYSTMMEHYWQSVWETPKRIEPQVIINNIYY